MEFHCSIQHSKLTLKTSAENLLIMPRPSATIRGMAANPEELLEKVSDRDSFIAFVFALASEREEAEEIERRNQRGTQSMGR